MRRKSSEINIFSMSALDLFASALGAFILLAVIFLPFFPNTGDHPAVSEAVMQRLAQAEAEVAVLKAASAAKDQQISTLQQQNRGLQQALAKARASAKFPPVDIVIAIDSTGSMSDQINGLKTEVGQFAQLMRKLSPDFGMGIVEFKDRCDVPVLRSFDLVAMNDSSIAQLQTFANQISTDSSGCNMDGPEAFKAALDRASQMNWRSSTTIRLIVMITDNQAYPEEVEQAIALAASFRARGAGYSVGAAQVADDSETRVFLGRIADAGGGELVSGGGSFTTTILLALAGV